MRAYTLGCLLITAGLMAGASQIAAAQATPSSGYILRAFDLDKTQVWNSAQTPSQVGGKEKTCADCPQQRPCGFLVPAGDGCNTCSTAAYCEDGQWYQTSMMICTLRSCQPLRFKIDNPFKKEQK